MRQSDFPVKDFDSMLIVPADTSDDGTLWDDEPLEYIPRSSNLARWMVQYVIDTALKSHWPNDKFDIPLLEGEMLYRAVEAFSMGDKLQITQHSQREFTRSEFSGMLSWLHEPATAAFTVKQFKPYPMYNHCVDVELEPLNHTWPFKRDVVWLLTRLRVEDTKVTAFEVGFDEEKYRDYGVLLTRLRVDKDTRVRDVPDTTDYRKLYQVDKFDQMVKIENIDLARDMVVAGVKRALQTNKALGPGIEIDEVMLRQAVQAFSEDNKLQIKPP